MKIAHVVDGMGIGGVEILVSQACLLLRERGHDPRVYVVGIQGVIGEQMQADGLVVQPDLGPPIWKSMPRFVRIFRDWHPDVVHLHNPSPTNYAALAARLAGVRCIVSTRHSLAAPPRRRIVELKYAFSALFCDWIAAVCDATAENLRVAHPRQARKIVRIYNGVTSIPRVAKELCPPKTGFTLVFAGRLAEVKNLGLLLRAFSMALESLPALRLWIIGDGSERNALEGIRSQLGMEEQVMFWGQQLDLTPFFSVADTFIMSSKSEGLPIALLQAFSLGVPAIVTDVGGMAEAVRLANAGFAVSGTDAKEMAAAIVRLAQNDSERKQFSTNAESAFHSHFTLETVVDAYLALYASTPRARHQIGN